MIVFDSAAKVVAGKAGDSIRTMTKSGREGRLSGALVSALRVGSSLRDKADSLELVIVSPLASDEFDAATDSIRSLWKGRATIVKIGAREMTATAVAPVQLRSTSGDPLAVTVSRLGQFEGAAKIVRDGINAEDAQSAGDSKALVDWPVSVRPGRAVPSAKVDTIGAVVFGNSVVVSAFPRRWAFTPDSIRDARVIARWTDGEPAAIEWTQNKGCVRSVAVPVNPVGDLPLQSSFTRFAREMAGACAADKVTLAASPAQVASLTGTGGLAPRDSFEPRDDVRSTLAPWLIGLGLVAALAELFVRRRRDEIAQTTNRQQSRVERAA
jgi:hypothetical protein